MELYVRAIAVGRILNMASSRFLFPGYSNINIGTAVKGFF